MKRLLLLVLCLTGCEPTGREPEAVYNQRVIDQAQRDDVPNNNITFRDGERAFEAGVPANANPFQGTPGYTFKAQAWLAGWIEASEKAKLNIESSIQPNPATIRPKLN